MTKKKTRAKPRGRSESLVITLVLCVFVSGLLIIHQSRERIENYNQLTSLRIQQDEYLSEYSRLVLEKESLSAYSLVLKRAEESGFTFPEQIHLKPLNLPADE